MNDAAPDTSLQNTRDAGFTIGLITGGMIGAALALAFAPRAGADLRRSVAGTARNLGRAASDRYEDASAQVGDAFGQLASKAKSVRDDAADAVVSSTHTGV
jgi:gas vesicle protein